MNRILLTQYGLKWNPFSTELPSAALYLLLRPAQI